MPSPRFGGPQEARTPRVTLRSVARSEHDAFYAMFERYSAELAAFDALRAGSETASEAAARFRAAIEADPAAQELQWIEVDGEAAGFLVWRVLPDWPDESVLVAEVIDCYVVPDVRRRGVAATAIARWLDARRAEGASLAEAGVLAKNEVALRFWASQGFITQAIQTVKRL